MISGLTLIALLACSTLFLRGLFLLLFRTGRRGRGALMLSSAPVLAVASLLGLMSAEARQNGFASIGDQARAKRLGYDDPVKWAAVRDDLAREEAEQALAKAKTAAAKAEAETKAEADRQAAKEAAFRATGRHCLNPFSGANDPLVQLVKRQLREPDSFEHIETSITPVEDGFHKVVMTYRARNGFGGMNVSQATGLVESANCVTIIVSVE